MTRATLTLFGSLLALSACSENELNNFGPGEGVGGRIEVSPPELYFGTLQQDEEDIKTFLVTNVGTANLLVEEFQPGGSASFELIDPPTNILLPPGAVEEIDVRFSPMGANDQLGHVVVVSEDPVSPEERVDLFGVGAVPELQIDPEYWDFHADFVGCGDEVEVHLKNVGTDDLVIEGITYDDPDNQLSLDSALALPMTLAPNEQTSVWVEWTPTLEVEALGELSVSSTDPRGVVTATQEAEGIFATIQTDDFVVPEDPPVDILFAVDQSCSMDAHATQLGSAFNTLIQGISQVTNGWRIGVATLDTGCFNYGVLTASTPNLQSTFASAVLYRTGSLSYTESLFRVALNALSNTGGCNAGFLRPDALLHIVLVSDEYEQSGIGASSFVTQARAYKASPTLVKVSGIICSPSGCGHADGYDTYYKDAVTLTGGVRLDVMGTGWGSYAQQLAAASLTSINRFELTSNAASGSIRVWVDGAEWTTGWHYDAATNEIVFDTNPPQGADISVEYGVLVPC